MIEQIWFFVQFGVITPRFTVTSSIYGNRSYESTVRWGPVNGTSAGKPRDLNSGSLRAKQCAAFPSLPKRVHHVLQASTTATTLLGNVSISCYYVYSPMLTF